MRKQAALSERIRREVELTGEAGVGGPLYPPPSPPCWCRLQRRVSDAWPCSTGYHSLGKQQKRQGWLVGGLVGRVVIWQLTLHV